VEAIGSIVLQLRSGFKLHLNNVLPQFKEELDFSSILDIDGFGCNFGDMKY
jgi:hypothetical protein